MTVSVIPLVIIRSRNVVTPEGISPAREVAAPQLSS